MYLTNPAAARAFADYRREQLRSEFAQHRLTAKLRRQSRLRRYTTH